MWNLGESLLFAQIRQIIDSDIQLEREEIPCAPDQIAYLWRAAAVAAPCGGAGCVCDKKGYTELPHHLRKLGSFRRGDPALPEKAAAVLPGFV